MQESNIKNVFHLKKSPPQPESASAHHVPLLVMVVLDDEDHIKTGQDGRHEVDVVLPLGVIPAAKH